MKTFSFIVPVYNMEQYIDHCVDSVVKNGIDDYEIILVNDGSKDHSGEKCDELALSNNNIRVLHKKNGGVSAARKDGLELAKGKYVIFLDCDDWIAEDLLQQLGTIVKTYEPEYISFGIFYETKKHEFFQSMPKVTPGYYTKEDVIKSIFPFLIMDSNGRQFNTSLNGKCFRRELCERYIIDDRAATMGEDTSVSVSCLANANSVYVIDKCLSYYRYNDNSATKGHKVFNWDNPYACNYFIEKNVPIEKYDFQKQLWRKTAYDVSSVVITRFYQDKSYRYIIKEISQNLQFQYYKAAIENANFKGLNRYSIMLFALKHSLFFMFFIYSKIKD